MRLLATFAVIFLAALFLALLVEVRTRAAPVSGYSWVAYLSVKDQPPPADGRSNECVWQVFDPVQKRLRWVRPQDAELLDSQPGGRLFGVKRGQTAALFIPRRLWLVCPLPRHEFA